MESLFRGLLMKGEGVMQRVHVQDPRMQTRKRVPPEGQEGGSGEGGKGRKVGATVIA